MIRKYNLTKYENSIKLCYNIYNIFRKCTAYILTNERWENFIKLNLIKSESFSTRNKKKLRFLAKSCRYLVDEIKEMIKYFSIILKLGFEMKKLIKQRC